MSLYLSKLYEIHGQEQLPGLALQSTEHVISFKSEKPIAFTTLKTDHGLYLFFHYI